jgi:RNA-directed DNA polymerase
MRVSTNGKPTAISSSNWHLVLCNGTKREAEGFKEKLAKFLADKLHLMLSPEKTKITHLNDGVRFLGYELKCCRTSRGMVTKWIIPRDAIRRLRADVGTHSSSRQGRFENSAAL